MTSRASMPRGSGVREPLRVAGVEAPPVRPGERLDLCRALGAAECRGHAGVGERPRDCEAGERLAARLRPVLKAAREPDVVLVDRRLIARQEVAFVVGPERARRIEIVGEEAAAQRAEP